MLKNCTSWWNLLRRLNFVPWKSLWLCPWSQINNIICWRCFALPEHKMQRLLFYVIKSASTLFLFHFDFLSFCVLSRIWHYGIFLLPWVLFIFFFFNSNIFLIILLSFEILHVLFLQFKNEIDLFCFYSTYRK